jgi:hypothetical protein
LTTQDARPDIDPSGNGETPVPARFQPGHGSIVTYVDRDRDDRTVFQRAVALGPEICDPQTDQAWLPVLRPDRVVTMVDPVFVVDVLPDHSGPRPDSSAAEVIDGTRLAPDTAMCRLTDLAAPGGPDNTYLVLAEFVRAIGPLDRTLDVLADAEPTGALAAVVTCLVNAAHMLDVGDMAACRAAIDAAHVVLDDLTHRSDRDGYDQLGST